MSTMTQTPAATARPTPATTTSTLSIRFLPPTLIQASGNVAADFKARKIKNPKLWESRHMGTVLRTFTEHRHGHTVITHLLPNQGMMVYATDATGKVVGARH